jgi:putative ABC transport system permease protein
MRRAEMGLRRSVGAAPRHIAVMIVCETVLTSAIGGVMGSPALGALAVLLAGLYRA